MKFKIDEPPERIVDSECPAPKHNSIHAGYGYNTGGIKCICVYSLWRMWQNNQRSIRHHNLHGRVNMMPVWWSGPWKIADECEARIHHTLRSATQNRQGIGKCVCPRSVALRDADLEKRRGHRARISSWYTGPWRILENCPADRHNTAKATRDRGCKCPRGVALLRAERNRKIGVISEHRSVVREGGKFDSQVFRRVPEKIDHLAAPDWTKAACKEYISIADGGFDTEASHEAIARREAAKLLCTTCPLFEECRTWVMEKEQPRGSWGGVWGGLDPWNRQGFEMVLDTDNRVRTIPLRKGAL